MECISRNSLHINTNYCFRVLDPTLTRMHGLFAAQQQQTTLFLHFRVPWHFRMNAIPLIRVKIMTREVQFVFFLNTVFLIIPI